MRTHTFLVHTLTALLCSAASVVSFAQGQKVTHTVQPGETLFKISQNYGVTVQQIIDCNQGLTADLIQSGQKLQIPVPQLPQQTQAKPVPQVQMKEYKVKRKDTPYSLAKANHITVDELMDANPQLKADGYKLKKGTTIRIPVKVQPKQPKYVGLTSIRVAVVLPLLGQGVENVRSVEFYRGLLMGIERLKDAGISVSVTAYEEPAPTSGISLLMNQVMEGRPDLIIGPVYPQHFTDVTAQTSAQTRVVVPFSSKVPQVSYRQNLFVLNTSSEMENTLASDLFLSSFRKSDHMVFLHSQGGDKADFARQLDTRLTAAGYDVLSHAFDLTPMALRDVLKGKGKGHFVIVPDDSRESTLKQLLQKTTDLRALMPSCTFSIVGYDSWMASGMDRYRNELHAADAYVFASSYFFPYTSDAIRFREDYHRWFRTDLLDCTPRMAPLGYDVAIGMLGGLATYGRDYGTQTPEAGTLAAQPKLQSDLRFIQAAQGGGYLNRSMWLVQFRPDNTVVKLSAK